jgi:hypothetical protein
LAKYLNLGILSGREQWEYLFPAVLYYSFRKVSLIIGSVSYSDFITCVMDKSWQRKDCMDPISIIITALVTGAATGAATQAVEDAYASVKGLIQRKYGHVDIAVLETDPTSKARQAVIKEDLEKTDAGQDKELLRQAKALLDSVQAHASDVPKAVGLDLEDIKGASLTAERILAEGPNVTGAKVKGADIQGDIRFSDVTARSGEETPPKKA